MTQEEFQTYIQDLVAGKAQPLNPTVGYLSRKFAELRGRYEILRSKRSRLEIELKGVSDELLRVEGQVNGTVSDLEHFCNVETASMPPKSAEHQQGEDDGGSNGAPTEVRNGIPVTDRRSIGEGSTS